MCQKACILIIFWFLYLGCAEASPITQKALKHHVAFLSSDELEGRRTGTKGEKLATEYAANLFQHLGLEPAGDHGRYFQKFNFSSGISLGKNNFFILTPINGSKQNLILEQEWRPLSFSDNQSFESTELVFAGYGITAPALDGLPAYDSYHGLNVKNKWVIVFRYAPEKISSEKRHQLSPYSSLRYKAFTAKENGAKGIIFVSGPNSKVKNELVSLSLDTSLLNSGIIAISVKDSVVNELLRNNSHSFNSLQIWQDKLDLGQVEAAPELTGIKMAGKVDIQQKKQYGRNVLARLRVGVNTPHMMIIGAHIDHLGRGELTGSRSREDNTHLIHHGADDNASGVASVFETAAALSHLKKQGKLHGSKDILFAIWSGEELGLLGSSHFIKNFTQKAKNKSLRPTIDSYINLDMIGRLRKKLILQGAGSSMGWQALIKRVTRDHRIPFILQNDPYLPTDSTSFYLHGVPALNFFTGSHDDYHTPRDKLSLLNLEGIKNISNMLVDLILMMESEKKLMDYQLARKTHHYTTRGLRVYLGTIPDYASANLTGVKLSGVAKGSPSERAGLKQDDVIVELAGKKIHDIYDYTFVLNGLHAGQSVSLVVLRGQRRLNLKMAAQSRE